MTKKGQAIIKNPLDKTKFRYYNRKAHLKIGFCLKNINFLSVANLTKVYTEDVIMDKKCGIIMPISALPSKYGIGSLGKSAKSFVDFLKKSGHSYWQILPLVQTGYGDSPYQSCADRSGNPYFIDLETLRSEKLLTFREVETAIEKGDKIDYGKLYQDRYPLLRKAFSRFDTKDEDFQRFLKKGEFTDYATFMALKSVYPECWVEWPDEYKLSDPQALKKFRMKHRSEYLFWQFLQFKFWNQWKEIKKYANSKGIKIVGDLPLYVSYDSVDVWKNPYNFLVDESLRPTFIAGVPPDYFSKTGQLWGNPVYNYEKMRKDGYSWWLDRIANAQRIFDVVRVDHFRGLDRFWSIPVSEKTAVNGEWVKADGKEIFEKVTNRKIIAEDLGTLDEGVYNLIDQTGFASMKVVLFAFGDGKENPYLPWNINENSVCYTGTHDNETVMGYLKGLTKKEFNALKKEIQVCLDYLKIYKRLSGVEAVANALVEIAYASNSNLTMIPIQDVLLLDNNYRMNWPGKTGYWTVRIKESVFTETLAKILNMRAKSYNRN